MLGLRMMNHQNHFNAFKPSQLELFPNPPMVTCPAPLAQKEIRKRKIFICGEINSAHRE